MMPRSLLRTQATLRIAPCPAVPVVALLALLALAGCGRSDGVQDVALRLGPAAFAGTDPSRREPVLEIGDEARPPVLKIGDEARPVVDEPRVTLLARRRAIPIESGLARFTVQLGPEARTMPDRAFQLAVKHHVPAPPADEIAVGASALHFVRRDRDWRLLRPADDPSRITLELDELDAAPGTTLEVRIESIGRADDELTSAPFVVPPRARLLLGFGSAHPGRAGDPAESTFSATLSCAGRGDTLLLSRRIDTATASPRWHDAALDLPFPGATCRLVLRVAGGAADAGSGVWAVPLVLARAPANVAARRNVVLISLDTLRADHLSAYGYPRATSPRIDATLAARGALFEDVSTTFPLTSPAHMSLMTGLFAGALPESGTLDRWTPVRTLAEALRDAGFSTGAYTENALLAGLFGFWFGFDRFVERPLVGEARGTETFADGARFLRAHRDRRFFLFLHTYKVHAPYVSGPAYAGLFDDPADWSGPLAGRGVPPEQQPQVDAYDRAIREADDQVASFLAELERLGLADSTYVVLLSDHGEAFGEHGFVGHGFAGHQEQLRIPLLIRGPGIAPGTRVAAPASIADVLPTLLEVLEVPTPDVQGSSLAAALGGAPAPGERPLPFAWIGNEARGLRRGDWKLLEAAGTRPVAFDLARDPHERRPVVDAAVLRPQQEALGHAIAEDQRRRATLSGSGERERTEAASERMMESLRALGYVQ